MAMEGSYTLMKAAKKHITPDKIMLLLLFSLTELGLRMPLHL